MLHRIDRLTADGSWFGRYRPTIALACALLCALASDLYWPHASSAQELRPRDQLLQVESSSVVLLAPPQLRGEAEKLATFINGVLPRLQAELRQTLRAPTTLALIDNAPHPALAELDATAAPWAAGYMLGAARVGGIRLHRTNTYPFDSTEMVVVHELTHQLLYDKVGTAIPTWFNEGVATLEGRRRGARDLVVFASLTVFGRIPRLEALDIGFHGRSAAGARLAYATSFEFLSWAVREHGPDLIPDVLDATAQRLRRVPLPLDARTPFEAAWQDVTGQPLLVSEERWRDRGIRLTRWLPVLINTPWLWIGMALLSLAAAIARRRQTQAQYRRWEAEELAAAHRVTAMTAMEGSPERDGDRDRTLIN